MLVDIGADVDGYPSTSVPTSYDVESAAGRCATEPVTSVPMSYDVESAADRCGCGPVTSVLMLLFDVVAASVPMSIDVG